MQRTGWLTKVTAWMLALLMLFTCAPVKNAWAEAAPAADEAEEVEIDSIFRTEAKVEGKTVPVIIDIMDENGRQEMEFTLYFVEGGDIPYVKLSDYAPLLSELTLYGEENVDLYGLFTVNAEGGDIEFPDHYFTLSRTEPFSAVVFNTADDTIEISDYNKFTKVPGHKGLVTALDLPEPVQFDLAAYYSRVEGLSPEEADQLYEELDAAYEAERAEKEKDQLFILDSSPFNIEGDSLMINLRDYLIDLVESNGECYVPLQTLTDLFVGEMYLYFVYNNDKLYIFSYGSDLLDEVNAKEPEPMSEEFALFNYNELRLNLDLHYGLKEEHGITDFGTFFQRTGILKDLTGTSGKKFDKALSKLLSIYLDDLHSGFVGNSWRHEEETELEIMESFTTFGASFSDMFATSYWHGVSRQEAYEGDIPMYEEIGDTAFITFDTFYCGVDDFAEYYDPNLVLDPSEFVIHNSRLDYEENEETDAAPETAETEDAEASTEGSAEAAVEESAEEAAEVAAEEPAEETAEEPAAEEAEEVDTIKLLLYAYGQITRENSPIERVVIDLSNNGGGMAVAAIFTLGFILNSPRIVLRDTMTGAQTISEYRVDVNRDNEYDYGDSMVSAGKKVYVMIAPGSFSCGNLVPAACKAAHITLVGQASGGGSCVVLPGCTASGALFQISGTKQLSIVRNGSFYNIDKGIEPDIYLSTREAFYDREGLVEYLHSIK